MNIPISLESQFDSLIIRAIHEKHMKIEDARCLCANPLNILVGITMLEEVQPTEPLTFYGDDVATRAVHMFRHICNLDVIEYDEINNLWRMKNEK